MEVSFGELLLIAVIAFLVLGPRELAAQSYRLGKWLGRFRTEVNNFKILAQEELLKNDPLRPKDKDPS